jgi:hypothetical protein
MPSFSQEMTAYAIFEPVFEMKISQKIKKNRFFLARDIFFWHTKIL